MKITKIDIHRLSFPLGESFGTSYSAISQVNETIVKVHTDEGLTGIGQANVDPNVVEEVGGLTIGEDPHCVEKVWEKMFQTTLPNRKAPARMMIMRAISAIDVALWDITGKASNMPVWRLLGGYADRIPVYASDGYYREGGIKTLVQEMIGYKDSGYTAVKMKIGRLSLAEDVARVEAVRKSLGDDIEIMLDANQAYDVETAIIASRLFEPYQIRWFEEPVRWYDNVDGLGQVAAATSIPVAAGEGEYSIWSCRDLLLRGRIKIMQLQASRGGGITPWRKVAAMSEASHVTMSAHHDPWIHVHLVGAVPNGLNLECFPNPVRDPVWVELFSGCPVVKEGFMEVPQKPGLGLELDEKILRKYAVSRD
ncbi:mandelate racemase/muconate lactonizing enzyme family protein [Thermodesulfobacteriota bacterium]